MNMSGVMFKGSCGKRTLSYQSKGGWRWLNPTSYSSHEISNMKQACTSYYASNTMTPKEALTRYCGTFLYRRRGNAFAVCVMRLLGGLSEDVLTNALTASLAEESSGEEETAATLHLHFEHTS